MRRMHVLALCGVMSLLYTTLARADRPREDRDQATYVLSGTVRSVYVRGTENSADCIVELKIEEVTKGERLNKGHTFYAYCSKHKPMPGSMEAAGHNKVPEKGQRVRVYVNDAQGRNEGVWPDWFDVLPNAKK